MKKLLSLWSLLILFAMSGSAVPLTADMYSDPSSCSYNVGSAVGEGGTIYGKGVGIENTPIQSVDLSAYSTLTVSMAGTSGAWRMIFNQGTGGSSDRIELTRQESQEVGQAYGYYSWTYENGILNLVIDLQAILSDHGKVELNAIKNNWGSGDLTVSGIELEPLATVTTGSGMFAFVNASSATSTWPINLNITGSNNPQTFTEGPIVLNLDCGSSNAIQAKTASNSDDQTDPSKFYVRMKNGNSFEFSVPEDDSYTYKITNIEMYGRRKQGSFSNFTLSGNIYSWSGSATSVTTTFSHAESNGFEDIKYISVTYEATPKQVGPVVGDVECKFTEVNGLTNTYEVYLDAPAFRNYFRLRLMDNTGINFDPNRPCTVTTVDDMGDPIESKVITLGTHEYSWTNGRCDRLDIWMTPKALGTATIKIEYPGDATYAPATYYFDVKVKQHIVELKWVKTDDDQNPLTPYQETEEWITNRDNGYKKMPALKIFLDNEEVSSLPFPVKFYSSDPSIASIDSLTGAVTFYGGPTGAGGLTVIEAKFTSPYTTVDGLNYYYYSENSSSYTMILQFPNSGDQPHIVWISGGREWGSDYGNQARGSYLGQQYIKEKDAAKRAEVPFKGNYTGYGNNVYVGAVALKSSITDADLESIHIIKIPGYTDHYIAMDDPNESWWVNGYQWKKGSWRAHSYIPESYLFDPTDKGQNKVKYLIDKPGMCRGTNKYIRGTNDPATEWNASGENYHPTSSYKIIPARPSKDSLKVYAYVEGYNVFSTTKFLVKPGDLQLRFVPDSGTVNAEASIMPYVNCPDLRLEDVKKIWLTYDCPNTLYVEDQGVVYESGVTSSADIAKYLTTVTAIDTIWNNADNHAYGVKEYRPTTYLRSINPEIFGLASGIGSECTVTLHLSSDMYEETTATYTLNVVGNEGDKPMFHWVVNDKVENSKHVDDNVIKKISVAEGDFIYMPGIVGNSNGNKEYSEGYTFKYLYSIKNGKITMNRAKYFPGEGVPNYYLSYTQGGEPAIPQTGDMVENSQPAIITWSIGLGGDSNKDSLMIYGNKAGVMYLYAQDPQTHKTCTPIQVTVVPKAPLNQAKQTELAGMSYPFTWDFEHMDMTKYVADVENNSGTYWQKKYVEEDKSDHQQGPKRYHRNYSVEKPFYQYNGGMNADWDDKDLNGTTRQRWFKDIYTGDGDAVEYAPEFKGMMINLAGLDYWEQKYQRFQIDRQGRFIYFEGGPIFVQLPGFGLTQNKDGKLKTELQGTTENPGTRAFDNYIGGEHNHINTAKYNVNEGYTQMLSVDNTKNKAVEYPVQAKYRNNKVRFVIKARGGRPTKSDNDTPNDNQSSQFHIGGASMIIENLTINDINWTQGVHNGYSYYNIDNEEAKVYIVELDPYDPELQDHIYLMFNNDVYVYWMAITNEPRDILSDFDGVTYSYPKDIDMEKTNLTLGMQSQEGIYTKADASGNYKLASVGEHTIKNVYQVGSDEPGKGTKVQLKAYRVDQFYPVADETHPAQSVTLTEVEGNLPKNEGVMLYTEPRMSALTANGGHVPGLTAQWYDRGNTAWSEYVTVVEDGEEIQKEIFHVALATDSTGNGNMYNNSHTYYTFPLYFIAMAENMSSANYELKKPGSTGGGVWGDDEPAVANGSVNREGANLLRPVTYGKTLDMDYGGQQLINFGYNNEFICRHLIYQNGTQTKEMDPNDLYVSGSGSNAHEDMYYYRIGPAEAKFYRINTAALNHHNRSAYMTLTWEEYKVNTVGKPINISSGEPNSDDPNDPGHRSPIRFSPTSNPVEILFRANNVGEQVVSEDGGFVDGINEVESVSTENNAVYNLNGVRVNNVSKGIYVIDGKKVVVK